MPAQLFRRRAVNQGALAREVEPHTLGSLKGPVLPEAGFSVKETNHVRDVQNEHEGLRKANLA